MRELAVGLAGIDVDIDYFQSLKHVNDRIVFFEMHNNYVYHRLISKIVTMFDLANGVADIDLLSKLEFNEDTGVSIIIPYKYDYFLKKYNSDNFKNLVYFEDLDDDEYDDDDDEDHKCDDEYDDDLEIYKGDILEECWIVHNLCDGGGYFTDISKKLRERGAKKVGLIVAHGIFSKGLPIPGIDEIITTNSYIDWDENEYLKVVKVF